MSEIHCGHVRQKTHPACDETQTGLTICAQLNQSNVARRDRLPVARRATCKSQYDESHQRIQEVRTNAPGPRTTWSQHPDAQGGLSFEREEGSNIIATNRHSISADGQTGVRVSTGTLAAAVSATDLSPTRVGRLRCWVAGSLQIGLLLRLWGTSLIPACTTGARRPSPGTRVTAMDIDEVTSGQVVTVGRGATKAWTSSPRQMKKSKRRSAVS